jgi:hypothetical protein
VHQKKYKFNMKNKIYIAGKVTGLPRTEQELHFNTAEAMLTAQGFTVVNPIKLITNQNEDWNTAMRQCIAALCDCSHLYLLKNYILSKGACLEYELATRLNIIIIKE